MAVPTAPIGIIIVSHGKFGSSILKTSEDILGPQSDCVSISVDAAHEVEEAVRRLNDASKILDKGEGVLVLTDMFGGTPTNLALSLLGQHKAEVITGVNLPMLLKVFENRASATLPELAKMASEAGCAGIVVTGNMLRKKDKKTERITVMPNLTT